MSLEKWKPSCVKALTEDKIFSLAEAIKENVELKVVDKEILPFLIEFRRTLFPLLDISQSEWEVQKKESNILDLIKNILTKMSSLDLIPTEFVANHVSGQLTQQEKYYDEAQSSAFQSSNNCIAICSYDRTNGKILRVGKGGFLAQFCPDIFSEGGNLSELGLDLDSQEFRSAKKLAKDLYEENGTYKQVQVANQVLEIETKNGIRYFEIMVSYLGKDPYHNDYNFAIFLHDSTEARELAEFALNNPNPVARATFKGVIQLRNNTTNPAFKAVFADLIQGRNEIALSELFEDFNLEKILNLSPGETLLLDKKFSDDKILQFTFKKGTDSIYFYSSEITIRVKLMKEVERMAITDSLTGLLNRREFFQKLYNEINRADRFEHPLSILMLDLDHFKNINDDYGHQVGDEVLKITSQVMQENCRSIDIIARYGGEEFIICLPETNQRGAVILAEKIRVAIANTQTNVNGKNIPITVSLGIAERIFQESADELIERADRALYTSKRSGRNRVTIHNLEEGNDSVRELIPKAVET